MLRYNIDKFNGLSKWPNIQQFAIPITGNYYNDYFTDIHIEYLTENYNHKQGQLRWLDYAV